MDHQKSALHYLEEDLQARSIPTSCKQLDEALNYGFRLGTLSEIVGKSGSGKTQLCWQLTINTILPDPPGLIDGEVIFISTKSFFPSRVEDLVELCVEHWNSSKEARAIASRRRLKFTREEALKKIQLIRVLSLAELISSIYMVKQLVESKVDSNIRLIVVDSFATFLLDENPTERIRIMYELLHILENIATLQDCAVVVTNNMTTHITTESSSVSLFPTQELKPALGESFHHRIQQRILLSRSQKDPQTIIANVQKNVSGGPSLVKFKITKNGIQDA